MACRLVGAKPLSKPMLDYCLLVPRNKLQLHFNRNSYIFTQKKSFENAVFCLGFSVLMILYELSKDENGFFFIMIMDKFYHKLSDGALKLTIWFSPCQVRG